MTAPPVLDAPPASHRSPMRWLYTPWSGANTGQLDSSLSVSVLPNDVTPSPALDAPLARNAAQPSVVPATTITSVGRPSNRATSARIPATGVPAGTTEGNEARVKPVSSIHAGQVLVIGSYPDFRALFSSVTSMRPVRRPAIQSAWWRTRCRASHIDWARAS